MALHIGEKNKRNFRCKRDFKKNEGIEKGNGKEKLRGCWKTRLAKQIPIFRLFPPCLGIAPNDVQGFIESYASENIFVTNACFIINGIRAAAPNF